MQNFPIIQKGTTVPAASTGGGTLVSIPAGTTDCLLHNVGSVSVYALASQAGDNADTDCMEIVPGSMSTWNVQSCAKLKLLAASGTGSIRVFFGKGA